MFRKRDNLEYEFLPAALEIAETPPSPLGRIMVWISLLLITTTVLYSYFGKVDIVATSRGKVIPDGRIKVIQPMEAGAIRAIHIEEGQKVSEGQLLIELDSTIKQADLEAYEKTLFVTKIEKEVLTAELEGKEAIRPNENEYGQGDKDAYKRTYELQLQFKAAREAEYRSKEEALKLMIAQRESALELEKLATVKAEKNYALIKQQSDTSSSEKLSKNEIELLNKKMELFNAEQQLLIQQKKQQSAEDALEESKKNLESLMKERERTILEEIMEKDKIITSVDSELTKARKQLNFQQLNSPVSGTIHGLASNTIGGIVTPAEPIATIVPEGTPLIIEANVQNSDIGFIEKGQEVEVKLDTFPFQKYGTIKGNVAFVSPDAFEDEKLGAIYKIKVHLERDSLELGGRHHRIAPGMNVTVEVKTGTRRIIEFFLSPIIKYAKESINLR